MFKHRMKIIALFVGIIITNISFGQRLTEHSQYIKEAYKLKEEKKYKSSAEKFKQAFELHDGKARLNNRLIRTLFLI